MMKHTKHILLTGTISVLLAACGGGGGGSGPSTASTNTGATKPQAPATAQASSKDTLPTSDNTQTAQTPDNSTTAQTAGTPEATKPQTPATAQANSKDTLPTSDSTKTAQTPDNSTTAETAGIPEANQTTNIPLVLETPDGTRINLTSGSKGAVEAKTDNGRMVGHNYTHSFYGVWVDNSKQLKALPVHGIETPGSGIPTSGSATYYGNAVRFDSITNVPLTNATSRINVNFGRKTVDGKITMPGLRRDITLHEGRLNGASYTGQASVVGNQSGLYEGKLYGPNAEETAGIVKFRSNPDLDTAFGGKRY